MVPYFSDCQIILLFYWIHTTLSMSLLSSSDSIASMKSSPGDDVTQYIMAKGYLPSDKDLPKPSILKNMDNDANYLLSKLSDDELVKLLSEQPNKSEYDVNDLVKLSMNTKSVHSGFNSEQNGKSNPSNVNSIFDKKRFDTVSSNDRGQPSPNSNAPAAYFRLESKEVNPYATKPPSYENNQNVAVVQNMQNLIQNNPEAADDDEKKEMLFDVLVAQLKTLCCKRARPLNKNVGSPLKLKALLHDIMPQETAPDTLAPELGGSALNVPKEHMFLILNDEIQSKGNDEIISVDPDSLGSNSTVMLLGPIVTPLSDGQLKVVMTRISNELSKPEYFGLLQQIADGTLSNEHKGLIDSLVTGPQTRRYIKPHRCNHQSVLAKVYGGPKWLICTGYLNLNKPSLYD